MYKELFPLRSQIGIIRFMFSCFCILPVFDLVDCVIVCLAVS